ncbi:hypothetical protein DDZ18_02295 [Marinicauda salina]|uniref:Tetratricopeptide repeat protein n=1 Tax=Marinicauda salina TaxID=2135793 RepID=A0A2U2BWQ9_9PROT|nr:hypothetical protein [Marinicauda salina]PWE18458.1 hypothetical protein DDZ18_02295 [Marinicauda salina]
MKYVCLFLAALSLGATAAAQEAEPEFSLLDQSRALREQTRAAAGAEDWEAARRTNEAALGLQPGHPGLLRNALIIGGLAGDAEAQFRALERMAIAGLAFDIAANVDDAEALRAADPTRYDAVAERLEANAAPVGEATVFAEPALRDALIESVAIDIETERLYLGSVADRRIYLVEPFSPGEAEVFAGPEDGVASVFGLALDRANRLLYAAVGVVPQTPVEDGEAPGTALLAFDMETGELYRRHEIDGAVRIADVAVRDGVVYAADAEGGRIYRLTGPAGRLDVFAEDSRFASLQGLAAARGAVWVVDYALGLWRIDPVSGEATLAATPSTASMIGLDGLATSLDGRMFVVRNGASPHGVFELVLDEAGGVAALEPVLTGEPRFGEPTTLRIADDRAFVVANAQWNLFPEDGSEPDGERTDPVILTFPVDAAEDAAE